MLSGEGNAGGVREGVRNGGGLGFDGWIGDFRGRPSAEEGQVQGQKEGGRRRRRGVEESEGGGGGSLYRVAEFPRIYRMVPRPRRLAPYYDSATAAAAGATSLLLSSVSVFLPLFRTFPSFIWERFGGVLVQIWLHFVFYLGKLLA